MAANHKFTSNPYIEDNQKHLATVGAGVSYVIIVLVRILWIKVDMPNDLLLPYADTLNVCPATWQCAEYMRPEKVSINA